MNLYDGFTFAAREVPHLFRYSREVPYIHGSQFCIVECFPHAKQKNSAEHGEVLVSRMPVSRNLCTVNAANAEDERFSGCAGVPCNWSEFAPFHDRCPLEIAGVHDFMR